jgi:DNA-binding CsgD family transcriptional regulator
MELLVDEGRESMAAGDPLGGERPSLGDARLAAIAVAAMALGIGTKVVSGGYGPGNVTLDVLNGALYFLCGMVVRARRPGQPIGNVMVLASIAWFSEDLVTAYAPALYYPGRVLANAFDPVLFQLLLGYPTGRLGSVWARAAVGAAWVVSLSVGALTGVVGVGVWNARLNDGQNVLAALIAAVVAVVLVRRYRRATPAARQRLVLFTRAALVVSVAYAADTIDHAIYGHGTVHVITSTVATAAVLLFPICVLISFVRVDLLRGRLAGVALGRLDPGTLEGELRRLLGDPSLTIARAGTTEEGDATGARATTPLARGGVVVGQLVHDRALVAEPEVLTLAAGLAVDSLTRTGEPRDAHASEAVSRLSPRERDVLALMAGGLGNAAIGRRLHVSERTVEKHVAAIFSAFELPVDAYFNRRVAAVVGWLQSGGHDG